MSGDTTGCPRHPDGDRACTDIRCLSLWEPEGAPTPDEQIRRWVAGDAVLDLLVQPEKPIASRLPITAKKK